VGVLRRCALDEAIFTPTTLRRFRAAKSGNHHFSRKREREEMPLTEYGTFQWRIPLW